MTDPYWADPRCLIHEHDDCIGGPCMCDCHKERRMIEEEDYDDDLLPHQVVMLTRLVRSNIAAEKEVMALRAEVMKSQRSTKDESAEYWKRRWEIADGDARQYKRIADRLERDHIHLSSQIEMLANVLTEEFGGPTESESACEMAVRVLREQSLQIQSDADLIEGLGNWNTMLEKARDEKAELAKRLRSALQTEERENVGLGHWNKKYVEAHGEVERLGGLLQEAREASVDARTEITRLSRELAMKTAIIEEQKEEIRCLKWRVNSDADFIKKLEQVRDERTALVKRLRTTLRDKERKDASLGHWNQKYVEEHQENERLRVQLNEARDASVADRTEIARLSRELAAKTAVVEEQKLLLVQLAGEGEGQKESARLEVLGNEVAGLRSRNEVLEAEVGSLQKFLEDKFKAHSDTLTVCELAEQILFSQDAEIDTLRDIGYLDDFLTEKYPGFLTPGTWQPLPRVAIQVIQHLEAKAVLTEEALSKETRQVKELSNMLKRSQQRAADYHDRIDALVDLRIDRDALIEVLFEHPWADSAGCACGWSSLTGAGHQEHVADNILEALAEPGPDEWHPVDDYFVTPDPVDAEPDTFLHADPSEDTYCLEHSDTVLYNVHKPYQCQRNGPRPCAIHNKTDHHMRWMTQLWRDDAGLIERICNHGVGHPDPDGPSWQNWVHGCCQERCCTPPDKEAAE